MSGAQRRTGRRPAELRVSAIGDRIHFARTEHVNWVIYAGPDGVTLVDSGYAGQRRLLEASLDTVGVGPADVAAVLVTHGHADHLGGAAWLATEFGTPVHAHPLELPNVRRDVLEQAGTGSVLRNAWRPGVAAWAFAIVPLLDGRATLGVPSVTAPPMRDDRLDVPGRPRMRLIDGHTSGHAVFEFDGDGVLAVGDALVTRHRTSPLLGPHLLPSLFHHDAERARTTVGAIGSSTARVVLPGHGEAWIGPADAAAEAALSAGAPW
ncbi:MBL fold metallo-hydrolase [Agromyces sp. LHK192]|uniref:MBL fold metallo-hydrolase n=1 Tax=Agromyces sp. LHK192 TaxID=2498704 RepID=UPI000FDA7B9A|nr:MBL fold metallo-hydrolase [Agromyces sp. LHK192]